MLGARLHEVLDPDAADGSVSGSFKIPALHARMLRTALEAMTAPARIGPEARLGSDGLPLPRPELLGGLGTAAVLDLGRSRRLHSRAQRLALRVQGQKGCTTDGCDRPAHWCQAHHDDGAWSEGGSTTLKGGRLLCSWHHHRAHDDAYRMTRLPDGGVRFSRRQ